MTRPSADQYVAVTKLCQAIRHDQQALKADLGRAIRRDYSRRKRRGKAIRVSALSLGAILILSGSALAAGDALGVIELGGGVSAARVSSLPEWNGKTGTFVTGGTGHPYIYHLTGGSAPTLGCGSSDPQPTNNIYVTSTRPLTQGELKEILDQETSHGTASEQAIKEGNVPLGVTEVRGGRYPEFSSPTSPSKLPAGVTEVSHGCPTPGVAGLPDPGSSATAGKAGITPPAK
jgi:hypothetical protein